MAPATQVKPLLTVNEKTQDGSVVITLESGLELRLTSHDGKTVSIQATSDNATLRPTMQPQPTTASDQSEWFIIKNEPRAY